MTTITPWIRGIFGRAAGGGVTRARLCLCPPALALLLGGLILGAWPVAAQTNVWSGTLTTERTQTNVSGCARSSVVFLDSLTCALRG